MLKRFLYLCACYMVCTLCTNSCVEEYGVDLNSNDQRIVIEATLDNQSQCLVRVTKTRTTLVNPKDSMGRYNEFLYEPVKGAQIILSDDTGQIDTAMAIDPPSKGWDSVLDARISEYYKYTIGYNHYQKIFEENFHQALYVVYYMNLGFKGYYTTTKFKAVPGHSYKLTVLVNGIEYTATDYMPPNVLVLDSVVVKTRYTESDGDDYQVPLLYFKNPPTKNIFYEFITMSDIQFRNYNTLAAPINLLDNEFLPEYIYAMPLCNEKDYSKLNGSYNNMIYIYSLSDKMFNYYKILFDQINNDGGAYTPSPANLPSDFNNGALGYFKTSELNLELIYPE